MSPCRSIALLAFALLATVAGCKKQQSSGDPGTGDIVIGHYGSITGSEATFGQSTDNGIKLAVKEINDKGGIKGRKVKLVTEDDAGKQAEAVNAVNKLIHQNKAVAIIGEVASSLSIAGGQICQKEGVPMISPSSTNPQVTKIGPMISRVCFIDTYQGAVGARFVLEELKVKKGATLYDRTQAYSSGLNEGFVEAFKAKGGEIVTQQQFGGGDIDFSAQIKAIKAANVDFVYVPAYYSAIVNIGFEAQKQGLKVPLVGGDGWVSDVLKSSRDALNGSYFTDHYSKEEKRPEVINFVEKYKKEYGSEPDSMAALGYDAASVLFAAMERSPSLGGNDLAKAIAETKDFNAVTGKITLNANRDVEKRAVVQKMQNGDFVFFKAYEVE